MLIWRAQMYKWLLMGRTTQQTHIHRIFKRQKKSKNPKNPQFNCIFQSDKLKYDAKMLPSLKNRWITPGNTRIKVALRLQKPPSATWLTLSAMVRPSLSILDPASAIFLAALMTSDVFFSGPFPLQRQRWTKIGYFGYTKYIEFCKGLSNSVQNRLHETRRAANFTVTEFLPCHVKNSNSRVYWIALSK